MNKGLDSIFALWCKAQGRFYDKITTYYAPGMAPSDRKKMCKKFSEEYYDKDKK